MSDKPNFQKPHPEFPEYDGLTPDEAHETDMGLIKGFEGKNWTDMANRLTYLKFVMFSGMSWTKYAPKS